MLTFRGKTNFVITLLHIFKIPTYPDNITHYDEMAKSTQKTSTYATFAECILQ
jgi:hypothetical protein